MSKMAGKVGCLAVALAAALGAVAQQGYVQLAPLNVPRQETGAARIGGFVYVTGGLGAGFVALRSVERYDIVSDRWDLVADMPAARDHMGTAAANGKLYVIGGYAGDFSPKRETFEYDPATNVWTRKADMPEARGAPWAVTVNGMIYVVGGVTPGGAASRSLFVYDPPADLWRRGPDMPTSREHLAAARYGTDLFAVGGRSGGVSTGANERFDTLAGVWTARAPMPTRRAAPAAAAFGGSIYVMGGETPQLFSVNEAYSTWSDSWTGALPMAVPRHGMPGVPLEDGVLLPGGGILQGLAPTAHCDKFVTGQREAQPTGFSVFRGVLAGGGLGDLAHSDQSWLSLRPGIVLQSGEAPVQLILTAESPFAAPIVLRFAAEAHASVGGIEQRVELFDFRLGRYEDFGSAPLRREDTFLELEVIASDPSRFVEPGTRLLRARLSYREAGPVLSFPWLVGLDQVFWTLTP